jgi:hypothetical protein
VGNLLKGDRPVMQTYGSTNSDGVLAELLVLKLKSANQEQQGKPIVISWALTPLVLEDQE